MRPLFFAVLATVAAGVIAATTATPPRPVPGYALGAELVYRTQVGLAVFVALYAATALSRLAYHGRTLTEIGTTGIKLPDVGAVSDNLQDHERRLHSLERFQQATEGDDALRGVARLSDRLARLERHVDSLRDHRSEE
jgi:hypothetical protein